MLFNQKTPSAFVTIPGRLALFFYLFLPLLLLACMPQAVEVTRVVDRTVVVTSPPEIIEVTRVISEVVEVVEVTRIVLVQPTPAPTGQLTVMLTDYPNSLDLPQANSLDALNVAWQLYDSLVMVDNQGNILPALAQSWAVNDDGTAYTFKLRRDVYFHNGELFNAEAVRFSWNRGRNPNYFNSAEWNEAVAVEVIDDYTVRIETADPNPFFLRTIADYWAIVPPAYFAAVGEEGFATRPVGTGAFRFESQATNDNVILTANPSYWQPEYPKVAKLEFLWFSRPEERLPTLLRGRAHVVDNLVYEQVFPLLGEPRINIISYPADQVYYIAFNNQSSDPDSPIHDPLVRQAMNYAVNRRVMITNILQGGAQIANGLLTPSNFGYNPDLTPFSYDPTRARELLNEAGYGDGFTIEMACPQTTYPLFDEVCLAVADDLAAVDITVELTFIDPAVYFEQQADRNLPPLSGDRRTGTGGEAYPRLSNLLGNEQYVLWYDPAVSTLIQEIRQTVAPAVRQTQYLELQQLLHDNPPFIYLYVPEVYQAIQFQVQGYAPRSDGRYDLKTAFLAR